MKRRLIATVFVLAGLALAQQPTQNPAIPAPPIRGSGCVMKAVESSCLVFTDSKSGKVYNLLFSDHPPAPGRAIKFNAIEYHGMTTCMQGKAVSVSQWKPQKNVKCPAEPEAQH